jgi:hypothetical protein
MIGYSPDLVVLLYSFNDMDYLAPLTPRPGLLRKDRIHERLHPVRVLFLNSYLFQDLYARWRKIALVMADKQPSPDPYANKALIDRHLGDLRNFVRVGRSAGGAVLIVPFENQVHTSAIREARYERFVRETEAYGLPVCGIAGAFANRGRVKKFS